jgi:Uma2 family endonuclease
MSTVIQTSDDIYPDADGKPMAEIGIHVKAILWLLAVLSTRFKNRKDVYVAANMFLYYAKGQPEKRRAPDIMVAKGLKDGSYERRSFKTWIEGVVPSCVIEVTSKKTAQEDLKKKKPVYQKIGVREYFMFDPLHDYLPAQIIGYRLVSKKYQRIKPDDDGSLISEELGLRLRPEGIRLGLYDGKTGMRLPTPDELTESMQLANELAEERLRNAELQKELAKLKAQHKSAD